MSRLVGCVGSTRRNVLRLAIKRRCEWEYCRLTSRKLFGAVYAAYTGIAELRIGVSRL
ncbi:hypothetical protein KCP78_16035 [Salmonella enterica subsp. enterica]|nr:hypothetical protein KCP78_16035 [Salmonella enterica subsp. enterica]